MSDHNPKANTPTSDQQTEAEATDHDDASTDKSQPLVVPPSSPPPQPDTDLSETQEVANETNADTDTEKTRPSMPAPRPGEITPEMISRNSVTKKFGDTDYEEDNFRWGASRFGKNSQLIIKLKDNNERYVFDHDDVNDLIIGRQDPKSDLLPEVDLGPHDGLNMGVSRRHAIIQRSDGSLHLVDQGSPNGTYLNGQKLIELERRILRDGDDIRLGHLTMRIFFRPVGNS